MTDTRVSDALQKIADGWAYPNYKTPISVRLRELAALAEALERDNAQLREMARTPSACGHMSNFLIGDEHGHFTCTVCRTEQLERDNARLRDALEAKIGISFHTADCEFDGVDTSLCTCELERVKKLVEAALHPAPASDGSTGDQQNVVR